MDKEKHNCDNVNCNHNNTKGLCCLFNPENCKYRQLQKENEVLKGRIEGFEKQILGLLYKYESVYKRFPDLKDAMNKAESILKENAELHDNYEQYKAVAEPEIKSLKDENSKLRDSLDYASLSNTELASDLMNLQKENAELKWERDTKAELAEHLGKANDKIADLEETINKLREQLALRYDLEDKIKELEETNKVNEWHYVKDGKYPTHSNGVLVFTDEGVGLGIYGLDDKKWHTYDTGFEVIAWKEIELPKESE